jgi:lipoate-protein ligase A
VFQNLAIDEAIARSSLSPDFKPTIRLWVNPPSVVIGRFQRASTEIDISFCQRNCIQVARRFTGGGAVYHDEGTLNLTIVSRPEQRRTLPDLNLTSSAIMLDALKRFGLNGSFHAPNSIMVGERKISGGAGALGNGYALWHGSLLVSTSLETLESALAPSKKKQATHFVRSRWQRVTNLREASGREITVGEAKSKLIQSAQEILGAELTANGLRSDEKKWVASLSARKYSLPSWNNDGKYEGIQETG